MSDNISKWIYEEIERQLVEVGLCHDDKGYFADCKAGNVYSLTRKGARDSGTSDDYVGRGTLGKKTDDDPPKGIKAKYGLNSSPDKQGGRKKISGEDIPPKYSVKRYPKRYGRTDEDDEYESEKELKRRRRIGMPERDSWNAGYSGLKSLARGITEQDVEELICSIYDIFNEPVQLRNESGNDVLISKCKQLGLLSRTEAQQQILVALNNFAKARDGKLYEPESP